MKDRKFIDTAKAYISAGNGGNGCASFRREKYVPRGGPDGGDGGRGGHVIFQADNCEHSLTGLFFRPHICAENGTDGRGKSRHGRNGRDLTVKVPCGTEVRDAETGELLEDLVEEGKQVIVAHGGQGGLGNRHWKTSTHQAPLESTSGMPGEQKVLHFELKLVAQVGLVGFPNAGKSSLLRAISNAHPRIASYPFTTLNPIIGTLMLADFTHLTLVDIPGIVEGAHNGTGLGHTFLKHIERTLLLVFVVDMAGTDGRDPSTDYFTLLRELHLHKADLLERPFLVLANKMDLPEAMENLPVFEQQTKKSPLTVSAKTGQGISELKKTLTTDYFPSVGCSTSKE